MSAAAARRQNFDVSPEQDAEIRALRETLGASSTKDAILRAVRIAGVLSRETRAGKVLQLRARDGQTERLIIPELEAPDAGAWRYLIEREHPWQRQMSIKGRRLLASTLWRDLIANGQTLAEAAAEWDLPVEAVEEAVRWCEANRALIALEAQEERLRIEAAGGKVSGAR